MRTRSLAIACLIASMLFSPQAWAQEKETQPPQVEPKFIWGLVINYVIGQVASMVFSSFTDWLGEKVKSGLARGLTAGAVRLLSKDSGARIVDAEASAVLAKDAVNTTTEPPSVPLKLDNGRENFQAAQVSVGVADPEGKLTFRPINQGFRTGERIKLHVIATFNGLMVIENINPGSERKQIYPAAGTQVVEIQAGRETLIPLADDQYFEFTRDAGEEQLVVTLRDARARGAAKSTVKVNRKDERYGSQFVQEVKPNTYPSIIEAIKLVHY